MKNLRFFGLCLKLTAGGFCRRHWPLAGLVLLYLLLPLGAGQAAGHLLSQGVDFQGVTLAVTAPEGDGVPQLLEQYMGNMEDIAQYCRILAMGEEEALDALRRGEVTAVLALPKDFIHGVMRGTNPDLRLIVAGDRPLESLLLLWVGQSASDILAAFQSGVYAVLDLYEEAPPPGLDRDRVVLDINLRYIQLALDRGGLFRTEALSATGVLPVSLHYALALSCYLALAAAPLFLPLYSGSRITFQRRLRCAGRGVAAGYFSAVFTGTGVLLLLLAPALLLTGEGSVSARMAAALGMALFCALFSSVCCLALRSAASCGAVSFLAALLALALAGGIVPGALLPAGVRRLSPLSPGTWLMRLAALPMGYDLPLSSLAGLLLAGSGMLGAALALYRRRANCQEVAL